MGVAVLSPNIRIKMQLPTMINHIGALDTSYLAQQRGYCTALFTTTPFPHSAQ
jgi:hypothetical protein